MAVARVLAPMHGALVKEAVVRKLRTLMGELAWSPSEAKKNKRLLSTPTSADMPIYVEQILQDFQEPCLFVYAISTDERADMASTFWQEHRIEVKFYADPKSEEIYSDCLVMGDYIRRALAHIDIETWVGGETLPTRAIRPEWRLFDGYGVYYATYRLRCKLGVEESPLMAQKVDTFEVK